MPIQDVWGKWWRLPSNKQLGDCGTGSTHAQSSVGIYGNTENSAFGGGRSVQVVIMFFFFFIPSIGIFPTLSSLTHTHTLQWTNHASPQHWPSRLSPFNALEFETDVPLFILGPTSELNPTSLVSAWIEQLSCTGWPQSTGSFLHWFKIEKTARGM